MDLMTREEEHPPSFPRGRGIIPRLLNFEKHTSLSWIPACAGMTAMKRHARQSKEGMALLLSIIFISAAAAILATLSVRLVGEVRQTDVLMSSDACLNGVELAFARSLSELKAGRNGSIGLEAWPGLAESKTPTSAL